MMNFTSPYAGIGASGSAGDSRAVALISPYHGGSHESWASGLMHASCHIFTLLSLPARFWKWRMHGGAVTLARRYRERNLQPALVLATDMLDLTTFLALTRAQTARIPSVLYMHENQLTYPLGADPEQGPMRRQHGERDLHYAFINMASMLAADRVVFNTDYHRRSFFEALPKFLKRFPEYRELHVVDGLAAKSDVIPVGIDLAGLYASRPPHRVAEDTGISGAPPLILWNQRWEYDKDPRRFFQALYAVADAGIPFRLALCGENFRRRPGEFEVALARLHSRIVHVGHAPLADYRRLLWEADVTVSTALHEFLGIAVLEAIACHTYPILPRALSYTEILPERFHDECLYDSDEQLVSMLTRALSRPRRAALVAAELAQSVRRFDWASLQEDYDSLISDLARSGDT
jgi:glycosyltransferase involved in cell wall biosynthesis